jgi:hypothetical protein
MKSSTAMNEILPLKKTQDPDKLQNELDQLQNKKS